MSTPSNSRHDPPSHRPGTDAGTGAASSRDLKRQILREAVHDNVATREGRPRDPSPRGASPPPPTPPRRRWPLWLAPLALAAVASGLALRPDGPVERAPASLGIVEAKPAESDVTDTPEPEPIFVEEPRPIDADVLSLAVRRIVIDPGHGGDDTGTTGSGLTEKELTLDIAKRVRSQLEDTFEVFMTREDDRAISLRDRAKMANDLRGDLFVSIHINWIAQRRVRGVETYFLGATDDPSLNAMARFENRHSGYSMADMKDLLEGVFTHMRRGQSEALAASVQRSLYGSLLRENPDLRNRGVKQAPFVVLVATEMPAILAEVSCLSHREEAQMLARPLYREHIAQALSRGVRRYAEDVNQIEQKGS
ncbi:MAG: N-acetylmuramoyl-L-alanine amidase [Acidobacteriota bacterium]